MAYAGPARQVRAQEGGLNVSSVIFALALLRLPQLYMCTYFVRGVETVSELRISLRRLDGFLSLPEPPPPAGAGARAGAGASGPPGAPDVPVRGAHVLLMLPYWVACGIRVSHCEQRREGRGARALGDQRRALARARHAY